jgi:hypothetical protein
LFEWIKLYQNPNPNPNEIDIHIYNSRKRNPKQKGNVKRRIN